MVKKRIFYVTKALILSACMMSGIFLTTGIVTAYAHASDEDNMNVDDDDDDQTNPDPIDYVIEVRTTEEDFGIITQGDEVDPIEFTVKNAGETEFTLAYKAVGDEDAFDLEPVTDGEPASSDDGMIIFDISENEEPDEDLVFLEPGETVAFRASVADSLEPGDYSVTYEFYLLENPESDARKAVDFHVTVQEPVPYITGVVVSPSNANVMVGKSYKFKASVDGGYDYDSSVNWDVTGNTSTATRISSDGILTVGNDENSSSLTIIATSRQDSDFRGKSKVAVQFVQHEIRLSTEPADGGSVSGGGIVRTGESSRATAIANDYYTFTGWYEGNNLVSTSAQIVISNITYDRSFTAVFKKVRYTISATVSPADAGRVENTGTYDGGESVLLRAVPNDGYDFSGWILDSQNVSEDLEYVYGPLEKNISLTASFKAKEPRTFRIESGTANQGGKISPSGDNYVQEGKGATYKMVPDSGYRVHAVAVDGVNIGAVDSYTFNNIYEEHSIAVSFEKIPEEAAASSDGSVNKKDSQTTGSQAEDSNKTAEEKEAEKVKTANEAEDTQTKPALIERIDKEEAADGQTEQKAEDENKVISNRELYDNTFTIEDESAPLAASADPVTGSKPTMAQKRNFILRIVVAALLAVVFASIGYTYFWLFKKKPSDDDPE